MLQLNRVKAVEKEKDELEEARNEAVEFLTSENAIVRLKNKLYQKYMYVSQPKFCCWGDHLPKLHSEEETNGFLLISGAASAQAWSAQPQLHLQFGADLNQSGIVITPKCIPCLPCLGSR